jgi:hypothetical protein
MYLGQLAISHLDGFVAGIGAHAQQFIQCLHRRLFAKAREASGPRTKCNQPDRNGADYRLPGQRPPRTTTLDNIEFRTTLAMIASTSVSNMTARGKPPAFSEFPTPGKYREMSENRGVSRSARRCQGRPSLSPQFRPALATSLAVSLPDSSPGR